MEFTKKAPDLKKGLPRFGHRLRGYGRRLFAVLLCASMVLSGFPSSFFQAFASDDSEEYFYELEKESLYEAICMAVSEGTTVDKELDFTGEYADQYAELFDADGTLYELKDFEMEKDRDRDKIIDLRVFARVEGDIPLDGYYEVDEEDSIIFLLSNKSKEETSVVIYIDDLETEKIDLIPASEVSKDIDIGPGSRTAIEADLGTTGNVASGISDDSQEEDIEVIDDDTKLDEAEADDSEEADTGDAENTFEITETTNSDSEENVSEKPDDKPEHDAREDGRPEDRGERPDKSENKDDEPNDSGKNDDGKDKADPSDDRADGKDHSGDKENSDSNGDPGRKDNSGKESNSDKTDHSDRTDRGNSSEKKDSSDRKDNSGSRDKSDSGKDSGSRSDSDSGSSDKTASVSTNKIGLLAAAIAEEKPEEANGEPEENIDGDIIVTSDDEDDIITDSDNDEDGIVIIDADGNADIIITSDDASDGVVITIDSDVIIDKEDDFDIASASDAESSEDDNDTKDGVINGELYEAVLLDGKKAAVAFATTAEDLGLAKYSNLIDQTVEAEIYETSSYSRRLGDDTTITLSGLMPIDATVKAYPVEVDIEDVAILAAYDITIFDRNGNEFQPEGDSIDVVIESDAISEALEYEHGVVVYHMEDEAAEPEEISALVTRNGTVEFEAESFSIYALALSDVMLLADGDSTLDIFKFIGTETVYITAWLPEGEYYLVYHTLTGEYYHFTSNSALIEVESPVVGDIEFDFDYEEDNGHTLGSPSDMFVFTVPEGGAYVTIVWDDAEHYDIYDFAAILTSEISYGDGNIDQNNQNLIHFETKTSTETGSEAIAGVSFVFTKVVDDVTYYGIFDSATETVTDDNGEPATRTYYTLTGWTESKSEATTLITDFDGYIHLLGLEDGTYYLLEEEIPSWDYEVRTDPIEVIVEGDGSNAYVENEPGDGHYPWNEDSETISGSKTWEGDNNNANNTRPDSITVHLYDSTDESGTQLDSVTVTAADNWRWTFTVRERQDGDYSRYYVQEVDIPYYTTTYDGLNVTNTYDPTKAPTYGINIYKYDGESNPTDEGLPGDPLEGAEFIVSRNNGGTTEYAVFTNEGTTTWVTDIGDATPVTSEEDGYSRSFYLPVGDYTLIETEAPDGYLLLGEDGISFTISDDGTVTVNEDQDGVSVLDDTTIAVANEPEPPVEVQIYKYDSESNQPLSGAKFVVSRTVVDSQTGDYDLEYAIFDDDGSLMDWTSEQEEATTITSGSDGYSDAFYLPTGYYFLIETETPYGYTQDQTYIYMLLTSGETETHIASVANTPEPTYTVDIYKYDSDTTTEDPLAGAEFIISRETDTGSIEYARFDESGDLIGWDENQSEDCVITSGDDGYIHINLPAGEYTITETKAPDGYIQLIEDIKVNISTEGSVTYNLGDGSGEQTAEPREADNAPTVSVGNFRGARLPDTGGPGTLPFQAFGFFLTGSALWLLFLTLRRRRRWIEN